MMFCKDFNIVLNKRKQQDIFKQSSDTRHSPLNYDQFIEALGKIAVEIDKEKIADLKKRLIELKKIAEKQTIKKSETEKTDGKGSDSSSDSGSDEESPTKKSKTSKSKKKSNASSENESS